MGKSKTIYLPPKPSTSPQKKTNIKEEADCKTNYKHIKGSTLIKLNEEERNCCRDTTSLKNWTEIQITEECTENINEGISLHETC